MEKCRVLTVTGTKGKTTVATVLSTVLRELTKLDTIRVTTVGHWVNNEQKSTAEDSLQTWGLVPSNCPGRYLYEALSFTSQGIAVLEASLGSSSANGIGYSWHDVGIFLNVFKDHIGSSERLKSQADIVLAKKFVFKRIRNNGWAVYNADDSFVRGALQYVKAGVRTISFSSSDSDQGADVHVYEKDGAIWLRSERSEMKIVTLKDVVWTFGGTFQPSVYNLMAVVAGVVAYFDGVVPEGLNEMLQTTRFDPYSGRLTLLENKQGVIILADYAHEEESLRSVAALGRTLTKNGGKVIGVVRLAYDRTDEHIQQTGYGIANYFDHFVVYDKIDGYYHHPKEDLQSKKFKQVVGLVSEKFAKALSEKGAVVDRLIREDEALKHAAAIAQSGDVVVFIVNDNIERSVDWVREFYSADFK
ncbi:MAG: hypothetical protein RL097_713 [Candidatus Parcubacteria bacterium]|jgi:UDP-N-acetylmuramyl tripeptide synthase